MKRVFLTSLLAVVLMISFCLVTSAQQQKISMQYVPRTERGTLFYLDIYSDPAISAAVFELRFDSAAVEYRDVDCEDENGCAMGNADGDIVKIAYSHPSCKSGKLCRLSFKALRAGTVSFSLHPTQAVDGELDYLKDLSDASLEVKLGKDDVILSDDAASRSEKYAAKKSSAKSKSPTEKPGKKSYGGERSGITEYTAAGSEATEATEGAPLDFTGGNNRTWFMLGGAVVLSAVLLVGAGYFIGKKRMGRPEKTDAQEEESAEDPMEEINKILDEDSE